MLPLESRFSLPGGLCREGLPYQEACVEKVCLTRRPLSRRFALPGGLCREGLPYQEASVEKVCLTRRPPPFARACTYKNLQHLQNRQVTHYLWFWRFFWLGARRGSRPREGRPSHFTSRKCGREVLGSSLFSISSLFSLLSSLFSLLPSLFSLLSSLLN